MGVDRLRVGWLNGFFTGRGSARAEDAQETPTQSHISPSILNVRRQAVGDEGLGVGVLGLRVEGRGLGCFGKGVRGKGVGVRGLWLRESGG